MNSREEKNINNSSEKSFENPDATVDSLSSLLDDLLAKDIRIGWPDIELPPIKMHGWFRPGNYDTLSSLLNVEMKCIVELGSWLGSSTTFLLDQCPNALVFAVDIWSNEYFLEDEHYDKTERIFNSILNGGSIYHQFLSNTAKYKFRTVSKDSDPSYYAGLIPMKMTTQEALMLLKTLSIKPDAIYVDASHHYDFVVKDLEFCLDLFPDAMLIGDDWDNLDVRRAVKFVSEKHKKPIYVHPSKTCWTFEREKMLEIASKNRILAEEEEIHKQQTKKIRKSSFAEALKMYKN